MHRKATFSRCRQYRYSLWREWGPAGAEYVLFIGLNPSVADELRDDPTVRRCIGFARRWGYSSLCMVNLFAFRATCSRQVKSQADPVGPETDRWLVEIARGAAVVVAAWGEGGKHLGRSRVVEQLLALRLFCLGFTKSGCPRHPLYVRRDTKLVPYSGKESRA